MMPLRNATDGEPASVPAPAFAQLSALRKARR
jgi:hypothetical protein